MISDNQKSLKKLFQNECNGKKNYSHLLQLCFLLFFTIGFMPSDVFGDFLPTRRNVMPHLDYYELIESSDWLSCLQTCRRTSICVSYSFKVPGGPCELYNTSAENKCDGEKTFINQKDYIYHQLRQYEVVYKLLVAIFCSHEHTLLSIYSYTISLCRFIFEFFVSSQVTKFLGLLP